MTEHGVLLGSSRRLWLIRPATEVFVARLEREAVESDVIVESDVVVEGRPVSVLFPPTWPGDALPLVERWLRMRQRDDRGEPWGGTLVERSSARAVGTIGCKAWPDGAGAVEVGYGLEPSRQGRGLATEGLVCLLGILDAEASVVRVVAETHEANLASQAVLRKCGFARVGEAATDEGTMIWWARPSPSAGPHRGAP